MTKKEILELYKVIFNDYQVKKETIDHLILETKYQNKIEIEVMEKLTKLYEEMDEKNKNKVVAYRYQTIADDIWYNLFFLEERKEYNLILSEGNMVSQMSVPKKTMFYDFPEESMEERDFERLEEWKKLVKNHAPERLLFIL